MLVVALVVTGRRMVDAVDGEFNRDCEMPPAISDDLGTRLATVATHGVVDDHGVERTYTAGNGVLGNIIVLSKEAATNAAKDASRSLNAIFS